MKTILSTAVEFNCLMYDLLSCNGAFPIGGTCNVTKDIAKSLTWMLSKYRLFGVIYVKLLNKTLSRN